MNSNKSEILVLAVFSFYMHAVKIEKANNRLENLDCSNMITVLVSCHLFTVTLTSY